MKLDIWLGRWKFDEVVLQAVGFLKICTCFVIVMYAVAFPGHIRVMVLAGVENGVVKIQTSGDICVGRFTSDVFLIWNEHHEVIPARFFAYRAVIHDGGLLVAEKVQVCCKIVHLLLGRLETGWGKVPLPWFHP